MGYPIAQLRIAIEKLRRELYQLGVQKSLTDPEVVKLSQELDRMLNAYLEQKLKKELTL